MTRKVGIIDYGSGNVLSVTNAFNKIGATTSLVTNPHEVNYYDHVVLPGVGAFSAAMENLLLSGMIEALGTYVSSGKPLLGICLGMQLMCRDSLEDGEHQGLGWVNAHVLPFKIDPVLKVPHMGWNSVKQAKPSPILEGVVDDSDVYFVHSYYVKCNEPEDTLLLCDYGGEFAAGFAHKNLYGLQFHPEKSQSAGLKMLENFLGI